MSLVQVFQTKVPEIFSFLENELGYNFVKINEYTLVGQKGDVNVHFIFDRGILFSVGIEIKGELGKEAISEARYRKLGATAIARCIDKSYKPTIIQVKNENDLIEQMMDRASVLRNYCIKILKGDVSDWERIVNCLIKR